MSAAAKQTQLQIRVTEAEKDAIRRAAERAGLGMSAYVLSRALPRPAARFQECLRELGAAGDPSFGLAELSSLLAAFTAGELRDAVASPPPAALEPFVINYVAAMVESRCAVFGLAIPAWVRAVPTLAAPYFGSALTSVRLHLLINSPVPFRRRNIFVDTDVGSRV
jgi:hypothetical protein